MNSKYRRFFSALVLTLVLVIQVAVCKADEPYHFIKQISISDMGGCKSMSVDEVRWRLYVVCTNRIKIVDLASEQAVGTITNVSGISGFAVAAPVGRGFVCDGLEPKMNMIELRAYRTLMKVETGKNPGSIIFEPGRMEIYVFSQGDNSVSIYEADDGDFMKNIKLSCTPGIAVADPKAGRIYCAVEGKNEIEVIDVKTHSVTNHWSVAPSEGIIGMAVDSMNHRLYLGCTNKMVSMLNGLNGQMAGALPTDQAVVAVGFNPARRYMICCDSEGTVSVANEYTPGNLQALQTFRVGGKVLALAIDSKNDRLFLATEKKILVYGSGQPPKR